MPRFSKVLYSGVEHRTGMTEREAYALAEIAQKYSPPGDRVVVEVKPDRKAEREFDEAYRDSKR